MSARPTVVREQARRHRYRANRRATKEFYAALREGPASERYKFAFSLVPVQMTAGTLSMLALVVLCALLLSGHATIS